MRKINYRLIVSDFDGTLLPRDGIIPERVKNAINEYVENGGIFAVCTGRMTASILPRVRELGLKGLVVAYQGTVIADIESGKILKKGALSCDQGIEVCKVIESKGKTINAYADEKLYTTAKNDNRLIKKYEEITGIQAIHISGAMSDFVNKNKLQCQKIISVVEPCEKLPLYEYMRETLGGKFEVTYSSEILVEVSPFGDDKGQALKYIADYYKIPIEKTVALGDNLNDLPMLLAAGVGVAVENSTKELKEKADVICSSCDDGGVAEIIEKYGFTEYYV
ncbi:MAG: Cof-type HAD-IIB family hydrolase [Clostridia bacterium]|nr:Cof-type HAD-IIB family hydrolase [Clostridia bacterium]